MSEADPDEAVIGQCLRAAASGPFFPDWEFETLFGCEREEILRIAERWPHWEERSAYEGAVNNALNMLLGYPHGREDVWHDYISPTPTEVTQVYARWRDEVAIDPSAKGHFDRLT